MQIIYPYPNDHRRNICYPLCTHPLEINFGRRSVGRSFACRSSVSYALASINLLFHNLSPPQFSDLKQHFLLFIAFFLSSSKRERHCDVETLLKKKNGGNIFNICILVQPHPLTRPPLLLFNLIQIFANFHNFAILICVNCH